MIRKVGMDNLQVSQPTENLLLCAWKGISKIIKSKFFCCFSARERKTMAFCPQQVRVQEKNEKYRIIPGKLREEVSSLVAQ